MARKILGNIDMTHLQIINLRLHQIAGDLGTPLAGEIWYNSTTNLLKWFNGTANIDPLARANHSGTQMSVTISDIAATVQAYRLDQFAAPNVDVSINSRKLTNVLDGTAAQDAATYGQMQAAIQGFAWKQFPVRATTTVNGALASAYANTQIIDGVTLATNDRILIKNQTAQAENGIYTVNAAGAPTRAVDGDTSAELINATVWVSQGTTLADTAWTQVTNGPITVNTTALVWAQVGGSGSTYTAGNGINIGANIITAVADPTPADLIVGAAGIKTDVTKVAHIYTRATIGDGAATSIIVTHNLNTFAVIARVWLTVSTFDEVDVEIQHTSVNTITLIFAVAPTTNQYSVVVHG